MQSEKFKFGLSILDLLALISVIFLSIFLLYRLIKSAKSMKSQTSLSSEESEEVEEVEEVENLDNPIPKFYQEVVNTLPNYPEEMQEFITAQAMHETGIFESDLFKKYNNAFGMKQPTQRKTTSAGISPTGYATYKTVADSIKDLDLYFQAKQYPQTFDNAESYVDFLKSKGYFEAPLNSYKKAVLRHLNALKPFAQ